MRLIDKPWGHEEIWAETESYVGKILHVSAGESLSLQFHRAKEETLYLLDGQVEMTLFGPSEEPRRRGLVPGEVQHVPPGLRHRIHALEDSRILEVSTPHLDDVVRLEDLYGRVEARKSSG